MGFSAVVYNINQVSLRQAITPERMQGRMNATMRFIVWGTIPIGPIVGGAIATTGRRQRRPLGRRIGSCTAFLSVLFSPVLSAARDAGAGRGRGRRRCRGVRSVRHRAGDHR